jgi:DNA-binding NarL/FixJ family response regulator
MGKRRMASTAKTTTAERLLQIFELIDFTQLPAETQPIARMLTDGFTQTEIATRLGRSDDYVASRIRELRSAMISQALAQSDRLDGRLREHLQSLR